MNKVMSGLIDWGRNVDAALLALRMVLGVIFIAHGSQKLFGAFGGGGLEGTTAYMAENGLEPASLMAVATGLSEFGGGLLVLFGLLTRLGGLAIAGVMTVAMTTVTFSRGFFGDFELNLILFTVAASLVVVGGGAYSLDRALGTERRLLRLFGRRDAGSSPGLERSSG